MVLNLITFASLLHKQASILGSHELILNELEKYFTVNIVEYQNINKLTKDDFSLLGLQGEIILLFDRNSGLPLQIRGEAPRIGSTEINLKSATLRAAP